MLSVTATVTAFGTASVKTADEFEAAMSKVEAVSGATASEMEDLTVKARKMGFKTKFSASEAAEAMNYMAMVGKVISVIGTIMTIVPKVSGVINVVKGAFIYLWNNCEGFRQFWIDLWEKIKQIAFAVWEGLKTFFTAAWQAISTTAQTIWNGIKEQKREMMGL